jgi:TRAP-type C4-dicarboxylate transport system permease small subunit
VSRLKVFGGSPLSLTARAERSVARLLQFIVGAIMLGAVLTNFANVVGRYVFFRPFIWAEEVMQFLNIWVVMLGAAVITRNGTHLKMDAVYNLTPPGVRRLFDAFTNILAVAVSLYVIVQALEMIRMLAATGQRSVIARFPMNLMYTAIPLGFGCAVLFLVLWFLGLFKRQPAREGTPAVRITRSERRLEPWE